MKDSIIVEGRIPWYLIWHPTTVNSGLEQEICLWSSVTWSTLFLCNNEKTAVSAFDIHLVTVYPINLYSYLNYYGLKTFPAYLLCMSGSFSLHWRIFLQSWRNWGNFSFVLVNRKKLPRCESSSWAAESESLYWSATRKSLP